MDLDEIKHIWQEYDKKLAATNIINEKIIMSMIREKSSSTLARMRRNGLFTIILMLGLIWFCVMSIIYNAFDFQYRIQYVPLIIYIIVAAIFIVYLVKVYIYSNVDLNHVDLKDALRKVIPLQERFMAVNAKLGLMFLLAGFMYLVSASLRVAQNEGIMYAVIWGLGGVAVNLTVLYIAHKLGAFKDHHGLKLKNQLKELEDLEQDLDLTT